MVRVVILCRHTRVFRNRAQARSEQRDTLILGPYSKCPLIGYRTIVLTLCWYGLSERSRVSPTQAADRAAALPAIAEELAAARAMLESLALASPESVQAPRAYVCKSREVIYQYAQAAENRSCVQLVKIICAAR